MTGDFDEKRIMQRDIARQLAQKLVSFGLTTEQLFMVAHDLVASVDDVPKAQEACSALRAIFEPEGDEPKRENKR